jgi:hypothetical protein
MTRLYAPAGLRALGIDDDDYLTGEDGTIEVADRHVAAALAHGCRTEPLAAEDAPPDPAGETAMTLRLAEAETRIAALERAMAEPPGRRRDSGGAASASR